MLKSLRIFAIAVLALGFAQLQATRAAAQAVDYYTHYDVTLNSGATDVSNILIAESANGSLTWAFSTNCGGSGCTTEIDNPFGSPNVPTTALLIGLTNITSNGADVVLMTNTAFGTEAGAPGVTWNSLFPNTSESAFVTAVELATSGGPFCPGVNCIDPPPNPPSPDLGLTAVFDFANGDGTNAYFNIGNSFPNSQPFDVLEFSNGVQIGTGTAWATSQPIVSAPEGGASLLYLLLAGAACFGALFLSPRNRLGDRTSA